MSTDEGQLNELMSSLSGCRALLRSAVDQRPGSAGPIEPVDWPTQPRSALAKAAMSAIEDFCRLCDELWLRPRVTTASNGSNSEVGTLKFPQHRGTPSNRSSSQLPILASTVAEDSTMDHVCSSFETFKRQQSSRGGDRLGVYRSAVIRQLCEIHRLLRLLVSESSREPPPDGANSRATSASKANEVVLEVNAFQELQETPTRPEQRTHLTLAGHQTAATDQSVSERSFVGAHSVGRKLCFASNLCVDSTSAQAAWARRIAADSPRSFPRRASERESDAEKSFNSKDMTLLSRVYRMDRADPTGRVGSGLTAVSTEGSIEGGPKPSDIIVFQRVLRPTPAPRKIVQERQLASALVRLQCRLDAIKLDLAKAEPGKPLPSSISPWRRRRLMAPRHRGSLMAAAAEHVRSAN